jgi:hypothetical protein
MMTMMLIDTMKRITSLILLCVFLTSSIHYCNAFTVTQKSLQSPLPRTHTTTSPSTILFASVVPSNSNKNTNTNTNDPTSTISYGESSRIYRRDVFSYDQWVEHRSTDRFVGNLLDILKSGIFRQLLPSCLYVSSIALFIATYNAALVNGYDDLAGLHHDALFSNTAITFPLLKIPVEFFNLCTPSLALLLGTK